MLNIVIPMAGMGSRFKKENYYLPKPFIDVKGKMMVERVLDGLKVDNAIYTLVIQEKFKSENKMQLSVLSNNYDVNFVTVKQLTQGAACTALASRKIIDNDHPLLLADSDNIFNDQVIANFINDAEAKNLDGSILTFYSEKDCFSYAEIDFNGYVVRTREKKVISKNAITGAYMFKHGSDFVNCAIDMIIYGDLTQNEYYMSNVYNHAINRGLKIGIFNIKDTDWSCVGTPEQLKNYTS